MHHMAGCENVFSASLSEKGTPAPALLAPAIRESVNTKNKYQSALCAKIAVNLWTYFAIL